MSDEKIRIWHQSFTVLENLPEYAASMKEHVKKICRKETQVDFHGMHPNTYATEYPGSDITYSFLHQLHSSQFVLNAIAAQQQQYDAYAICTLPDPALRETRSVLDIPVVAYGEAAMHLACFLGERFGILVFIEGLIPLLEENARRYGLSSKLAGIQHAGFSFKDVLAAFNEPYPQGLVDRFEQSAEGLIEKGADVIIPGEAVLCVLLASHGIDQVNGVPVLDALAGVFKMAEMLADLYKKAGLKVNRRNYFTRKPNSARVSELIAFYGLQKFVKQDAP